MLTKLLLIAAGILAIYCVALVPAYDMAVVVNDQRQEAIAKINRLNEEMPTASGKGCDCECARR